MSYLSGNELIYNNDLKEGIHSGGFSVNSIMMREGFSPILTLSSSSLTGGSDKVSDMFSNLVVPNWAFFYGKNVGGGSDTKKYTKKNIHDSDTESDDELIDDELHDKLLDLVKEQHNIKSRQNNKGTKKNIVKKSLKTNTKKLKTKV
jgi:hypothetical protein